MARLLGLVFIWVFTCLGSTNLCAQKLYWIVPEDTIAMERLKDSLVNWKIEIRYQSDWLHAYSIRASHQNLQQILSGGIRCNVLPMRKLEPASTFIGLERRYSYALKQMQAIAFYKAGLSGLGVKVGITDAGFLTLNDSMEHAGLDHLWKDRTIVSTHDFVRGVDTISFDESVYTGKAVPAHQPVWRIGRIIRQLKLVYHGHGSDVLNCIAGYNSSADYQSGLAPDALFYLARTDNAYKDYGAEEDYYVASLEWMYRQGVRLVNTSLGYGRGSRKNPYRYNPTDMNSSSMIAKAVNIACTEKNMLVIVAAGNEGDKKSWRVVSTPGDASAALTVGAVLMKYECAPYSGKGPEFNTYLKPDVVAYSQNGTSFSSPAICGFAACLLEANPDLTAAQLKMLIIKSGHLYPYGNNYVGYGVPLASRALKLLEDSSVTFQNTCETHVKGQNIYVLADSIQKIPYITVFHKKDVYHVIKQEVIPGHGRNTILIHRPKNCVRSTIQYGYNITEVYWE